MGFVEANFCLVLQTWFLELDKRKIYYTKFKDVWCLVHLTCMLE